MTINKLKSTYSEGLEAKHNRCSTISNFQNKMQELVSTYDLDPETIKCIHRYSEEAIEKISKESKDVQEHSIVVDALNDQTSKLVKWLSQQRVYGWIKGELTIHNYWSAANDDAFSDSAAA